MVGTERRHFRSIIGAEAIVPGAAGDELDERTEGEVERRERNAEPREPIGEEARRAFAVV
ncbi:hypothetical protein [Paenibacillus sp.]|uniref:hypothetical protein n=1 Tax=Paenibacillus sp. TaxID=58172 RepID=UPI002812435F|nr:hypothetical protein [Paenibacillus sp.]